MTRVLVVEDEESYSDALAYMLRKEGYDVAVATTGPDALTEFDRNGADIVLLDLMLPGLPGTEVCRVLRSKSSVPVISGRTGQRIQEGHPLGAYFARPLALRTLFGRSHSSRMSKSSESSRAVAFTDPMVAMMAG